MITNEIIHPNYKRPFSQFVKKAAKPLQVAIEDAVEAICSAPNLGEAKKGDLAGIWVYKFRFNRQTLLVAYRPPPPEQQAQGVDMDIVWIDFYQVGSHENFYDALKKYLAAERTTCTP